MYYINSVRNSSSNNIDMDELDSCIVYKSLFLKDAVEQTWDTLCIFSFSVVVHLVITPTYDSPL